MPQSILDVIVKHTQKIARLERKLAKQKAQARQQDTRTKISLGGLVIKAKLDPLSEEILLGGLLELEKQLTAEPSLLDVFQAKGEAVFLEHATVEKIHSQMRIKALNANNPNDSLETPALMQLTENLKRLTRRKIEFGGIILKTELRLLNKAQLLGALVSLNEALKRQPELCEHYEEKGKALLPTKAT